MAWPNHHGGYSMKIWDEAWPRNGGPDFGKTVEIDPRMVALQTTGL